MRIHHTLPVAVLLCLILTSCTELNAGKPTPGSTTSDTSTGSPSSGSDNLPSNGAPKVEHPLDNTQQFEQDPCSILSSTQAQDLGLPTKGKEEDGALGLDCLWFNPDTRGEVTIGFLSNVDNGLSGAYAANERGEYSVFEPLPPIDGYPAVALDIDDRRPRGICSLEVGVTDQLAFHVDLQLSQANVGTKDPCDTAALVAGKALQTIKGE